ncbi:glycosyltransferase family 39 protein [Francisella sp. LA112445]|uniref:glycosyltransferase family 39 protein n=1 Tax=Francisella sp. LA112445 TaxID=1395624 RepID=UPI001788C5EF|nr:glycosyltransferase family 39 protein [Francisella sp. LA112445]QIW10629.1 glycosyltransferase family 39 protein [Francisella sp. LA112445]
MFIWVGLTALFYNKYAIAGNVAENLAWSNSLSFMYDKHPGLGAFILKVLSLLTFGNAILADVLSSGLCVLVSLIYIYKICKRFFSKEEATFITVISTFSAYYILQYFIMYNQNVILLPFWVIASYYFILVLDKNLYKNWIMLAIFTALGVYAKFEILLLSGIMFLYILFFFKREYVSKLITSAIVFFIAIIPAIIGIIKQNYTPILWIVKETNSSESAHHDGLFAKFFIGQFYNILPFIYLAAPIIILLIFFRLKKIGFSGNKIVPNLKHPLVALWLYPLVFVSILQSFYGKLPDGWVLPLMALFIPAVYKLFNFKMLSNINFKKLIVILVTLQFVIFASYNLVKYFNSTIISENTGNDIANKADIFWSKYYKSPILYVGGYQVLYLASFSKSKPTFLRDYNLISKGKKVLIAFGNCDNKNYQALESSGFSILHKECTDIKTVNKYNNIKKKISLVIAEK